ncbi:MAG: ATP-binding protein [Candidatus ainarchaeum sp.]|nr:ATP-binding protein [Candidatus ainarchaeum sp.]
MKKLSKRLVHHRKRRFNSSKNFRNKKPFHDDSTFKRFFCLFTFSMCHELGSLITALNTLVIYKKDESECRNLPERIANNTEINGELVGKLNRYRYQLMVLAKIMEKREIQPSDTDCFSGEEKSFLNLRVVKNESEQGTAVEFNYSLSHARAFAIRRILFFLSELDKLKELFDNIRAEDYPEHSFLLAKLILTIDESTRHFRYLLNICHNSLIFNPSLIDENVTSDNSDQKKSRSIIETEILTAVTYLGLPSSVIRTFYDAEELRGITVRSEPFLLYLIIKNIISNAMRAAELNNVPLQLEIFVSRTKECVLLCFRDNGCGMDSATIKKLNTGESYTSKEGNFHGLGFQCSRKFAEQMGGKLYILESEPGLGSKVVLELRISN